MESGVEKVYVNIIETAHTFHQAFRVFERRKFLFYQTQFKFLCFFPFSFGLPFVSVSEREMFLNKLKFFVCINRIP